MSPCCGRPNNRSRKNRDTEYYSRYAYLDSHQKAKQLASQGSKCDNCNALTVGDPCAVCQQVKVLKKEEV